MRTFRYIYINFSDSLRFFADIRKILQKGHNFWQFKDHAQVGDIKTRQMAPFFSSALRALIV